MKSINSRGRAKQIEHAIYSGAAVFILIWLGVIISLIDNILTR